MEEEAFLNIYRTADVLVQELIQLLKPHGLSITQYNILRILRGAGSAGVTCKEIGRRMVTPDPDITRLLDRLENRQLLTRNRAKADRRFVAIEISAEGLEVLHALDEPARRLQIEMFEPLGQERTGQLIELLEIVRTGKQLRTGKQQ